MVEASYLGMPASISDGVHRLLGIARSCTGPQFLITLGEEEQSLLRRHTRPMRSVR